eukprot:s166_g23.t1
MTQPTMASRPKSAGSMIRASSFSDMGRAARIEEWGAAGARQHGSNEAKVSRTRSSSTAGRPTRRPSEPAAVAAGSWNELVALSPQVLLNRLTKGVEKGRSWLGTMQMDGPSCAAEFAAERPRKSKEVGSHGRQRQRPPSTSTAAVEVPAEPAEPMEPSEPTPEPEPSPDATCAASPKDAAAGRKDAEASGGSRAAPAPAPGPVEKARCRPFSGGYAGELSRIEAEALLQRLTAQSGNLDEVRRLRKLLEERADT